MARVPSALVGGTSLALTTTSELGSSNSLSRARFETNSSGLIGAWRIDLVRRFAEWPTLFNHPFFSSFCQRRPEPRYRVVSRFRVQKKLIRYSAVRVGRRLKCALHLVELHRNIASIHKGLQAKWAWGKSGRNIAKVAHRQSTGDDDVVWYVAVRVPKDRLKT